MSRKKQFTVKTQKGGKTASVPKRIYVRMRMDDWGSIKIPHLKGESPLSGDGIGSCGLLMCYRTKKAFLAQHPKEIPVVFRPTKP